ncbi:MAG: hypothetical protein EBQ82_04320 [Betaproteobacteria bacterium]|nr:hypothetical protein [Betaproteobacteria bacterium]
MVSTQTWQGDPMFNPAAQSTDFLSADWASVPKVGFERVVLRQNEDKPSARVFDDSEGFELTRFELQPGIVVKGADQASIPALDTSAASAQADAHEATSPTQAAGAKDDQTITGEAQPDSGHAESVADVPADSLDASAAAGTTQETPDAAQAVHVDPQAMAHLREQAFQEGLAQGRLEGHAQGWAEGEAHGRAHGELTGQERGIAIGLQQAEQAQEPLMQALREQMQAQLDPELALLKEVTLRLQALVEKPDSFYEPLKRLALHLAEQLVLAELTVSGNAIERLVQRCLDELDLHGQGLVTIELNPQDKARLEEKAAELMKNIHLQALPQLKPGSVRVLANDTQVEDLVQTRLQTLAHTLLGQPEVWREQSSFFNQPLAQRDTEVTDADPRQLVDPRQVVEARNIGDAEHG